MVSTPSSFVGLNGTELTLNVSDVWKTKMGNETNGGGNLTDPWTTTMLINGTGGAESGHEDIKQYIEYQVALYVNRVYMWVVVGVGVPGNIAAIFTLFRMRQFTSSFVYMCVLAMFDLMTIVIKLLYLRLTSADVELSDAGCQVFMFIGTFCMHFANWVLVVLTVERYIAVWFPLKIAKIGSVRRATGVLVVIAVILIAFNVHFFWTYYEGQGDVFGFLCMIRNEYDNFGTPIWYWIDGAIYSIIPTIMLVNFNTLIIIGLRKSARRHQRLTNSTADESHLAEHQRQQRQVTSMLILVSIVFILLTAPNCLFFIFENRWDYKADDYEYAKYILAQQIVYMLSDSNHAINFFLYFMGGQKFRRCFLEIICFCRKRHSQTATSNIHTHIRSTNTSVSTISTGHTSSMT